MALRSKQSNPLIDRCKEVLSIHWRKVLRHDLSQNIEESISSEVTHLLRSRTKTYRYVLPTQLIVKLANPSLDSRCLQAGRKPEVPTLRQYFYNRSFSYE